MEALDLTKVKLSKFSFYYIAFVLVISAIFKIFKLCAIKNPKIRLKLFAEYDNKIKTARLINKDKNENAI